MKLLLNLIIIYHIYILTQATMLKKEDVLEDFKRALVRIKSRTEVPFVGDTEEV